MTAIDLSKRLGLVACFLLTFNLFAGPPARVPLQSVDALAASPLHYFRLHNWTAYVRWRWARAHPLSCCSSPIRNSACSIWCCPWAAAAAGRETTIGAAALYALMFVVTTSYARHRDDAPDLGNGALHRLRGGPGRSCPRIVGRPSLKHHAIDWFDGEKVASRSAPGYWLALGVCGCAGALLSPSHFTSE